jgi:hypothetical protein
MEEIKIPQGWSSYSEPNYGKSPNEIPSNPLGNGESDSHSRYVDPEGEFGAAKTGSASDNYGGSSCDYKPVGDNPPGNGVGQLNLPQSHVVVEDGVQNHRVYYLVRDEESDKFYSVVPDPKGDGSSPEYRGSPKNNRAEALQDAYRLLSATLPESALSQLRERFPETPILD